MLGSAVCRLLNFMELAVVLETWSQRFRAVLAAILLLGFYAPESLPSHKSKVPMNSWHGTPLTKHELLPTPLPRRARGGANLPLPLLQNPTVSQVLHPNAADDRALQLGLFPRVTPLPSQLSDVDSQHVSRAPFREDSQWLTRRVQVSSNHCCKRWKILPVLQATGSTFIAHPLVLQ
jgi:hypothetical protein